MIRRGLILLACWGAVYAAPPVSEEDARYQRLINELRCLVCQNQTIAESNAPLAEDLRVQVRGMIEAGRSDAEIHAYMTARYGDFVLYRPPLHRRTWLLWLGPFVLLAAGATLAALIYRRAKASPGPMSPADAARLREILEDNRR